MTVESTVSGTVVENLRRYLAELKERGPIPATFDDVMPVRSIILTVKRDPGYLDALVEEIVRAAEASE